MSQIRDTFEKGEGILQLTPTWVPRPFNRPGRRLRLHPDDYFAMGMERGAIVERWFSSITHVETKGAGKYEGMSFVNVDDNPELALRYNVMSIPTLILFRKGEVFSKEVGARSKRDMEKVLNRAL